MSSVPTTTLRFAPDLTSLPPLLEAIEAFAAENGLSARDTHAFILAIEELFANTLLHSDPPATSVEVLIHLEDGNVRARYSDDGAAFDPTQLPSPDVTLPPDERHIGGLGIHLLRSTMSVFDYRREGAQNVTIFGKKQSVEDRV
jgi:serine/threonine-protein kinase RsbW